MPEVDTGVAIRVVIYDPRRTGESAARVRTSWTQTSPERCRGSGPAEADEDGSLLDSDSVVTGMLTMMRTDPRALVRSMVTMGNFPRPRRAAWTRGCRSPTSWSWTTNRSAAPT